MLRAAGTHRSCARTWSNNQGGARMKAARVYARIADRRRDFLHKPSTRLVRQDRVVVVEVLTVRIMVENHMLSRAVSYAAWTESRSMSEYKAAWYGRELVTIDRFFPSSRCSACGVLAGKVVLNVRERTRVCGVILDRDVNTAINIRAAGLAASACGAGVRPQRESSRTGRPATEQEGHGAIRDGARAPNHPQVAPQSLFRKRRKSTQPAYGIIRVGGHRGSP